MIASPRAVPRVRNRIGWRQRLARLGGSPVELDLRAFDEPLADILRLGPDVADLSDDRITRRAAELRAGAEASLGRDALQAPLFALVREAAGRTLGLRPFDVQVVAALALARGRVVEMQTGEGKTLAAVMPAALHALTGDGVHVLTFNDYLARRDAKWMEPIYRMARPAAAGPRRHAHRRGIGTPGGTAACGGGGVRGPERQERRGGGACRRARR